MVVGLAVDPFNPPTLCAIQYVGSTARTRVIPAPPTAGPRWENVELDGLEQTITLLVFDPRSAIRSMRSTGPTPVDGNIYRSTDGGVTWENIGGNRLPESRFGEPWHASMVLVPDPAPGGALYAATPGGLFKWVPSDR